MDNKKNVCSFFHAHLADSSAAVATGAAAAFNTFGFIIELLILENHPAVPRWPIYFSMVIGAVILSLVKFVPKEKISKYFSLLFVLNACAVSFALFEVYRALAGVAPHEFPFQASKLGAIVAGLLAPGLVAGILGIGAHVGSSLILLYAFSAETRALLHTSEPWALLAFGLGGLFALFHRMRILQLQAKERASLVEMESTRHLAENFLKLRDLMNTPVQSIEIGVALLEKKQVADLPILEDLKRSCQRLRELNDLLKKHESTFDWTRPRH